MTSIENIPIQPDRPKKFLPSQYVSVAISIVALIVSLFSFWGSHRISKIQIAQASPHLYVEHAELRRLDPAKPRDFTLWMDVKNEGHLNVTVNDITVHPGIWVLPGDEARKACYDDLKKLKFKGDGIPQNVDVPKLAHVPVYVPLPDSCSDTGWRFFAEVEFKGRDQVRAPYDGSDELEAMVPSDKP